MKHLNIKLNANLIGANGNIYNLVGLAREALKKNGYEDAAETSVSSYIDEFAEKFARDVLRYGDIVLDKESEDDSGCIRKRLVMYEHNEYYVEMKNGNIIRFELQDGYFA